MSVRPLASGLTTARKAAPMVLWRRSRKTAVLAMTALFAAQGGMSWPSLALQVIRTSVPHVHAIVHGSNGRNAAGLDTDMVSEDGPRNKVSPILVERRVAVAAISVAVVTGGGNVVHASGTKKARDQLVAARTELDELIAGYGDIVKSGGGDAVRGRLGK